MLRVRNRFVWDATQQLYLYKGLCYSQGDIRMAVVQMILTSHYESYAAVLTSCKTEKREGSCQSYKMGLECNDFIGK